MDTKSAKEIDGLAEIDMGLEWRNGAWYINRDVVLAEILRRVEDIEKQISREEKEEK